MTSLRAAATLVFLALLSPEGLALRSSPKKKAVHKAQHRHHKAHKSLSTAAPVAAAAEEQKSKATGEAQFGHIQAELVEAWKHKAHMANLRQTLEAEQTLLSSQQSLVESDVEDASDAAVQQQVDATKNMIEDAKVLLVKSRQDALKQTQAALKEAHQIKKTSEQAIEASNLAIKEATKAKEEAEKNVKSIAQVIHAATEEAKFFFNQEMPDTREEKASTKFSPTLVKEEEKKIVSVAEKQKPAKPQPKATELAQQMQKMQHDFVEEGPIKVGKQTVSVVKKQGPANPQPKQVELKEQVQENANHSSKHKGMLWDDEEQKWMPLKLHEEDDLAEEGPIKEEKKTVSVAEKQGPATPQPKQVELKEQVQKKHDSAVIAKEENAGHSSKHKGMFWDDEEQKWMPLKLHEEDDLAEEGPIKEEKKTVSVAEKQGPATPQPKQVELKEQVQKKHDSAVIAKEENADHSSKHKGMFWDDEEKKWMPVKLLEEDSEEEQ